MSRKKIVFGVVILAVLILAFTFGSKHYDDINTGMYDPAFKAPVFLLEEYKSSDDVLDPDAIVEDLNQLQKDIEDIHPKTLNGLSVAMTEAFKEAHEKARNPMTVQAFTLMVARIVRMLDDSQTYVDTYAIDARKIERELGWRPAETFDSGIRKTVQWYLGHAEWVQAVQSGAYRDWVATQYGASA